jgi:hypothetical protein
VSVCVSFIITWRFWEEGTGAAVKWALVGIISLSCRKLAATAAVAVVHKEVRQVIYYFG